MPRHPRDNRCSPAPRRGGAMVFVLVAVAVAAVLSYALLNVASLDVAGTRSKLAATQDEATAEAAARLAVHYLAHPEQSPEAARSYREDGGFFYRGQAGLRLVDDAGAPAAEVTVTPRPDGRHYDLRAVSGDRAVRAVVRLTPGGVRPVAAVQARGSESLGEDVRITGDLWIESVYKGADEDSWVSGTVYSGGNRPTGAAGEKPVPDFDALTLVRELIDGDGWYTYNGERCRAQKLDKETIADPPGKHWRNPGRVYYWDDSDKSVLVNLPDNRTFRGTLVSLKKDVEFLKSVTIQPEPGLPAVVTPEQLKMKDKAIVTLRGVAYVGGHVHADDDDARLVVEGALLVADARKEFGSHAEDLRVTWKPAAADVVLVEGEDDVEVVEWRHE